MSFIREVGFTNDKTVDTFGRARVSQAANLLDAAFIYDLRPLRFFTSTSGAGTVVKTTNESSATLTVGTASGDLAILQSRMYVHYQPGLSQLVYITGFLGAAKANVQAEIGYNDANDGLFFRQANGVSVVSRSSTSGSPVDTVVAQASWNIDHMDGTGPSGVTINFADTQLFVIDFQWLATGRVRFGFNIGGTTFYCHQFQFANTLTSPYSNRGNLPVRWRITNTGVSGSSTTLKAICCSVQSESTQVNIPGMPFTANNATTAISVTTRRPVLSIQVNPTFAGITNREQVVVDEIFFVASSGSVLWEIVLNGTLTGASFTAVDTNSGVNRDSAATAISGGTILASGYASGGGDVARGTAAAPLLGSLNALGNNLAGTTGDILSLVCTAFTGAVLVNSSVEWHEIR